MVKWEVNMGMKAESMARPMGRSEIIWAGERGGQVDLLCQPENCCWTMRGYGWKVFSGHSSKYSIELLQL